MAKLADADIALLIDLVARVDALFSPPRMITPPAACLPNPAWAAVMERREVFPERGLSITFGGSATDRKEAERRLGDLETAGYLVVCTQYGRRVGVRLTPRGDDVSRYFAAEPMAGESWAWLVHMALLIELGVCRHRLIREDDLARFDYGAPDASKKMIGLELDLAPLKAAGLVDDTADGKGHVWYNLTPEGVAAVDGPPPKPKRLPKYQSGFGDEHGRLFDVYLAERLSWKPEHPNHVVIPQSCGVGPTRSWRDAESELPPLPVWPR